MFFMSKEIRSQGGGRSATTAGAVESGWRHADRRDLSFTPKLLRIKEKDKALASHLPAFLDVNARTDGVSDGDTAKSVIGIARF